MTQFPATLVVGYDFSDTAAEAASVAFSLAEKIGARVRAVMVIERRYERRIAKHGHLFVDGRQEGDHESPAEWATEIVGVRLEEELRAQCPVGVQLDLEVARGKPFGELLRVAQAAKAEMILIGGTGLSRAEQWVLGSTAERLARRSVIPTLVVRRGSIWEPRRILCPVDFSDAARLAFHKALWLARLTEATVRVLHVVAGTEARELETLGLLNRNDVKRYFEVTRMGAEQQMERLVGEVALEGLTLEQEILYGRPHEKIIEYAQQSEADLIVMGSLGRNQISDLLIGNTTERVLRKMPCSVLTVKPEPG